MGRSPCCDEKGLKKGPWTPEEDQKLVHYIQNHGHGSWRALPKLAGLMRCGKSCRLRWTNYLRPDIKRGKFSPDEEQTILNLHSILGNKWSAIATHLPGRTDNEIKNFWNTHLKKKLIQMGFDPMTHRPRTDFFAALPHLLALANLVDLRRSSASWPLLDGPDKQQLLQYCLDHHHTRLMQPPPFASSSYDQAPTPCVVDLLINPDEDHHHHHHQMDNTLIGTNYYYDQEEEEDNDMLSCFTTLFAASTDHDHHQAAAAADQEISRNINNIAADIHDHYFIAASTCDQKIISTTTDLPPLIESNPAAAEDGCSSSSCGVVTSPSCSAASFWPDFLLDDPFMPAYFAN